LIEGIHDNESFYTQTVATGSKSTAPTLSGSASSYILADDLRESMQAVGTSSAVYVIAQVAGDRDNYSLTTIGGSTIYIDNITDGTEAGVTDIDMSADSSGNLFATLLQDDNNTLSAISINPSGGASYITTDNYTMVSGTANRTSQCSAATPSGGGMIVRVGHDNLTHQYMHVTSAGWAQQSVTVAAAGVDQFCDIIFDADGKGWFAGGEDNSTGVNVYSSTDNFSTLTAIGGPADIGALNDVKLGLDPTTKQPILALSGATTARMVMYDNTSGVAAWAQLGPDLTVTADDRIGLAIVDTNTFVMSTTNGDNTTITVFYDN